MLDVIDGFGTRRFFVGTCMLLCLGVVVAGLLLAVPEVGSVVHADPVKVGLVPTEAGVGDLSFNWMAYQGLVRAENDLGVVGSVYTPTTPIDYGPMLQQCVDEGNQLCVGVGWFMAEAMWDKALSFPDTHFALVDYTWESYPPNLRGMTFAVEQAGYLAGTLAGLMTESDVVGGIGGIRIPGVVAFLEPYRYGAGCANPEVSAIITYTGTFTDPDLGVQVAQAQMAQGADVIFGAAAWTGDGALLEAAQSGAWAIGVDSDQWLTLFGSGSVPGSDRLLTSAMKRVDSAVYHTIADEVIGAFTPGSALYDLSVDGVGLAPFHEAEPAIPVEVVQALDAVEAGLLSGAVDPWDSCASVDHVGLVFDSPAGAGDLSFNWMAYEGLLRAETDLGVIGTTYTPTEPDDYGPLLQQCVDDGNGLCITVGWLMTDATLTAAGDNPGVDFAILDATYNEYPENLRGMTFAPEQAGYLAGTLAGLMTASDVAGAVGGMEIAPVQAFMEPYGNAIGCANPGATVLLTYTGTFVDPDLGAQVAQQQMDLGADVVFGCGGPTGHGAILHATQNGAWGIGVDVDQWVGLFGSGSVPGSDHMLTSAMKRLDNAVYQTIDDELSGQFTPGTALYDLSVDGVGLAPYHEADPAVPQWVRDRLDVVEMGLLQGTIDPWQACTWTRAYLPAVLRSWEP
jgi:basic membrane lipoprotein Med (substrate-binding protein (PBP1-ABC) superfamily)